jgi:uncharacterized membrane protein YphA (DoxX/SURF4 family)
MIVNVALWIVQILLAIFSLMHGLMMWSPKAERMQGGMGYILAIPPTFRRFIGMAEILAAPGLILPAVTGILPWLTPLAAIGTVIIMVGAIIFHIPRKEYANIVLNLIILAMAAFAAYGRFVLVPL